MSAVRLVKKMFSWAVVIGLLVGLPATAHAVTADGGAFQFQADVQSSLSLNIVLRKNSSTGTVIATMDFGKLVDFGTGSLRSSPTSTTGTGAVCALISVQNSSSPYTLTQTGTALINGTTTLPAGACAVVPLYIPEDNGGAAQPSGSSVGTRGTWVTTAKTLYTSGPGGYPRTVTCYYSITDDPGAGATEAVPLNQKGGNYSGTITFTVTY